MKTQTSQAEIGDKLEISQSMARIPRLKLWLTLGGVALAIILSLIVWRMTAKSDGPQYRTEEVRRGSLSIIVNATGTLQPTNQVDVSSELSGIVKKVAVDYNDRVKAGQVLAQLDTTKLEAQLTQSKAALESARAKVLQTQATVTETLSKLKQYLRVRELSNNKAPSQLEMDAAEALYERAKADGAAARAAVLQAEATVEANQTDLKKADIRSPINGIVITRSVEPGQTVASSLQAPILFTLAEDLTQMELQVDVDEADVGKVRASQSATFTVDAYPDRKFQARITQVRYGSKTVEGVVTYKTILKMDNADLSLRPGMTATADIVVKSIENALLVPNGALRFVPETRPDGKETKAPSKGLVGALLPRPPQSQKKDTTETKNGANKQQQIWELKEGKLSPVTVVIGSTNGILTEVVSGSAQPGMQVVVEAVGGKK
jgi:HlyD family secretion protein